MKKISGYFFRTIFIVILTAVCQWVHAQSLILPSAFRIGTDVIMMGETMLDKGKKKYEITGDIDIYKYFISVDYGWSQLNIPEEGYEYNGSGHYARIGVDYNFNFADPDEHVIFFGLRYSRSFFSEEIRYTIDDTYYGYHEMLSENPESRARWWEMNTGLKVKIWKQLYLGYTARFKLGKKVSGIDDFIVYSIPGYGKAENKSTWGFSYYIYYRIPFRYKPLITPKSEKKKVEE